MVPKHSSKLEVIGNFSRFFALITLLVPSIALAQFSAGSTPLRVSASASDTALFQPVVTYGTGETYAYSVAVADVNGDGMPDLLVANGNGGDTGSVGVLLGNGDGTFKSAVTYDGGGGQTAAVAVADLNGDGNLDLIVANSYYSNTVGVLLGNGDGTFRPVVTYSSGGGGPWSVVVADVNRDGKPDVLVANQNSCYTCTDEGLVGVLLGNGDGTLQPAVMYRTNGYSSSNRVSLAVADLNGDGNLDLVVTNACGRSSDCLQNGSVAVLLGKGDGTFAAAVNYDSGAKLPYSVAVADLNRDGKPDLLVANDCVSTGTGSCGRGTIGVRLGNGNGTFQPPVLYNSGGDGANSVAVADINGDGKIDVLTANFCAYNNTGNCSIGKEGTVGVLLGNGDGTLQPAVIYGAGGYWGAMSIAVADVNRDGRPDLEVVNLIGEGAWPYEGSVGVLLNNSTKAFASVTLTSSLNPSIYGQKVSWTAQVTTSGSLAPTGTVAFTSSGIWGPFTVGTAALSASGIAILSKSNLNAGPYPLTAVYKGDANNAPSSSAVLNQTVLQAKTAATITSSVNPSSVGQAVTYTARITSPTVLPTGPVTFAVGTTLLGTVPLSGGKATFTTSSLPAGSNAIKVTYQGNSNIARSSARVTQVVQP